MAKRKAKEQNGEESLDQPRRSTRRVSTAVKANTQKDEVVQDVGAIYIPTVSYHNRRKDPLSITWSYHLPLIAFSSR